VSLVGVTNISGGLRVQITSGSPVRNGVTESCVFRSRRVDHVGVINCMEVQQGCVGLTTTVPHTHTHTHTYIYIYIYIYIYVYIYIYINVKVCRTV